MLKTMHIRNYATVAVLLAVCGMGCASGHHHHHSDDEGETAAPNAPVEQKLIIVNGDVNAGPPPLRVDTAPPQPAGASSLIAGHWLHDPQLNAWIWVPGRWR